MTTTSSLSPFVRAATLPRIIGTRRDGRPVFAIMGGAPDDAGTGDPAGGADPAAGADPAGADPATGQPSGDDLANLPADKLASMVRELRGERSRERTEAKSTAAQEARQQLIESLKPGLVELGLLEADQQPTAEELAQALSQAKAGEQTAQETTRLQAVELELYKTADKHGAKPAALVDSRTFLASVANLDPAAVDFRQKIIDAATKAAEENDTLKAARAAGKGGAEFTGRTGGGKSTDVKPGIDRLRGAYSNS